MGESADLAFDLAVGGGEVVFDPDEQVHGEDHAPGHRQRVVKA